MGAQLGTFPFTEPPQSRVNVADEVKVRTPVEVEQIGAVTLVTG